MVSDYSFTGPTIAAVTSSITAKALTASAAITAAAKTYDGLLAASTSGVSGDLSGEVGTDAFTLNTSAVSLNYSDAHVVGAKTIAATGNAALGTLTSSGSGAQDGSSAGNLVVSVATDYALSAQPAINSVAGTITAKALTSAASIGGTLSKTYDGTTTAAAANITGTVTGAVSGDTLTLNTAGLILAYNNAHVVGATSIDDSGTAGFTIASSTASSVVSDYNFTGPTIAAVTSSITAKTLNVTYTGVNKVYDGTMAATVTTGDDRVAGDTLTITPTATFADKNVGNGKTVTATLVLSGASAGNYTAANGTATANITRLNSVTWTGGSSGNWFDPANWGGAVPDQSNVANVIIPNGTTVVFGTTVLAPAQSGTVNLDGIGSAGSLSQTGGALNLGRGGMTLNTFIQSDGTLNSTGPINLGTYSQTGGTTQTGGNFSTTTDFSQGTSGTLTIGGTTSITDTTGGSKIGNMNSTGTINFNSTGGDITQSSGTTIAANDSSTFNASNGGTKSDITLTGANNNFVGPIHLDGNNVAVTDGVGGLILGNVTTSGIFNPISTDGNITLIDGTTFKPASTQTQTQLTPTLNLQTTGLSLTIPTSPLTLPTLAVSSQSGGPPQGGPVGAIVGGGSVVVMQVRDTSTGSPGLIRVEVSGQSLRSDAFEFSVPGQAAQTLRNQPTAPEAVMDNEQALPGWLRFDPATLKFTARGAPAGALPIRVVVKASGLRVAIEITEMANTI